MTEEKKAACRVTGEETLPPDWGMEMLCSIGKNHCCSLYGLYNHEEVCYQTIVDISELLAVQSS